jgi:hypothetical protein
VQPIAGCGLAILCVFSHFYLKEVMNGLDWIAITLAGIGTIGELQSQAHNLYCPHPMVARWKWNSNIPL